MLLWTLVMSLAVAGADRYHDVLRDEAEATPLAAEARPQYWVDEAAAGIHARQQAQQNTATGRARNLVMFLGDGMSVPTLAAARTLLGQRRARPGEEAQLAFEAFPTVGLAKTYCLNAQIADSACTSTAYLCGVKANRGTLGVGGAVTRYDCAASTAPDARVHSIAAWALRDGRDAGIVTTTRVTHASPAGAYAAAANRHWENDAELRDEGVDPELCPDIAHQLVNMFPGNQFKVILGGGRREFLPTDVVDEEGSPGRRTDGRNLIQEWESNKQSQNASYAYVWNREQLMNASTALPEYLLGLFENDHLQYHLEANTTTEPTLAELTEIAIKSLSRNEKGFFLFVESGRIDHAHHDNYAHLALDETIALSDAVAAAASLLAADDSLLVVTSDHSHVMTINGYKERGGDILGPSDDRDINGVPYMTLSYTNGPGGRVQANGVRVNILEDDDIGSYRWRWHAEVPLSSETHGGEDVAVFARGPQHGMFSGLYEQSQLPHLMAYAGCLRGGAAHIDQPHCNSAYATHSSLGVTLLLAIYHLLRL